MEAKSHYMDKKERTIIGVYWKLTTLHVVFKCISKNVLRGGTYRV
jgi:hypothetical protein